jgi:type II secretory pathway pseudopilin PulG
MSTFTHRRGFTLVEIFGFLVILAILAGVTVPRFFDFSDRAKTASAQTTLGAIRTGLANHYADKAGAGKPAYPTLAELVKPGTVIKEPIPVNPFNGLGTVEAVKSLKDAQNRVATGTSGWRYFVDNTADPPVAIFYPNSDEPTIISDGEGGLLPASRL